MLPNDSTDTHDTPLAQDPPSRDGTPNGVPLLIDELGRLAPQEILDWALGAFRGRIALSASFGGGGIVLAHMLSRIDPSVPVLFLDTGFHFPETLAFKERFAARHGLNVVTLNPASAPEPLYAEDPDRCCTIHKVEPMRRALAEGAFDAWVSALRRDQSATRSDIRVVERDDLDGRVLIRIHPLAAWTRAQVWRYIHEHALESHPLLDHGYTSIGCWPCTRATHAGEDERAGRWSGTGKTECGLHTFTRRRPVENA